MKLLRTPETIEEAVNRLKNQKRKFTIRHGTYTDTLVFGDQKIAFSHARFSNRVFAAANMIRRDVEASALGQAIIRGDYEKSNFNHRENLQPVYARRALNIDITSAYARCLFANGLITPDTYNYMLKLRKHERLPAAGMLARGFTLYHYEGGRCVKVEPYRAPTAQVFYYLIAEINNIMMALEWELGSYFYFYWVDGIFFRYDTPKNLVTRCENIIAERGYEFKYESVTNFRLTKNEDLYTIRMTKNGEPKQYQFTDSATGKEIQRMLYGTQKENHNPQP